MKPDVLDSLSAQQARQGIRRLLVLSGQSAWCEVQTHALRQRFTGDWLWVGNMRQAEQYCAPAALRAQLGREFLHAIFDARESFDAEALAALAGMLKAGSWLVLMVPPWHEWPSSLDSDSLRWSECSAPIATPVFVRHIQACIERSTQTLLWRESQVPRLPFPQPRADWRPASGTPLEEQAAILTRLQHSRERSVAVVTAARGRGKSALAGMLIHNWPAPVVITAPAKAATDVLQRHAAGKGHFIAPDALAQAIAQGRRPPGEWLIIDEAAAIPAPQLRYIISAYPRVLMTTTVQGYEGTGRGFMLKFCASVPHLHHYRLSAPVRWAVGCPLERIIDEIMLFDDTLPALSTASEYTRCPSVNNLWASHPALAEQTYRLLSGAHYRTSPLDLRRMMDAPGQHFTVIQHNDKPAAAVWLVDEGGLSGALSQSVWAGFRRPRGSLVAQSLAAHGASPFAATLKGLRISRIAVHPELQRRGFGSRLLANLPDVTQNYDYLSVSFGYTEELWRFWERAGFVLVRFGTHREASSGCYTAMALRALTPAARRLVRLQCERLGRDVQWLSSWVDETIPVTPTPELALNNRDWWELAGFAFAHRPAQASLGSLHRLLLNSTLPLVALRAWLSSRQENDALCRELHLNGRKALLAVWRQEAAQALVSLEPGRAQRLRQRLLHIKKFQ